MSRTKGGYRALGFRPTAVFGGRTEGVGPGGRLRTRIPQPVPLRNGLPRVARCNPARRKRPDDTPHAVPRPREIQRCRTSKPPRPHTTFPHGASWWAEHHLAEGWVEGNTAGAVRIGGDGAQPCLAQDALAARGRPARCSDAGEDQPVLRPRHPHVEQPPRLLDSPRASRSAPPARAAPRPPRRRCRPARTPGPWSSGGSAG